MKLPKNAAIVYDGPLMNWSGRQRLNPSSPGVTYVYLVFDGEWDRCLYIGTSTRWASRFEKHKTYAPWWQHARRLVLIAVLGPQKHRNRQKLWRKGYDLEQRLIAELRPAYNIAGRGRP